MNNNYRPRLATLSVYGITHLQRQNPYMVAWWSAAFPGFGHYLLNQYVRATMLTLSELIINTLSHVNEAIVYSMCGKFEMAKAILEPRWLFGYLFIYFFTIWDSYRGVLLQNKMCHLAELENERIQGILIHPFEIQYIEQKNPFTAAFYSFLFPGLGQLYNHRFGLAFYAMFWWWFYVTFSHAYEALLSLILGNPQEWVSILHPHWLMFMPSVAGGAVYHAFITAVEHNWLYRIVQRQHLAERYRNSEVRIFP